MKPVKDQRGVALVLEFILVAAVAAVLGAVGYRYYQARHKAAPAEATKPVQKKPVDLTAGWKIYSSASGQFSFRYKPDWQIKVCDAIVMIGPPSTLGLCNSGAVAEMEILPLNTAPSDPSFTEFPGYGDQKEVNVVVSGIAGKRYSAKGIDPSLNTLPAGTVLVDYVFQANGRYYLAQYKQAPSGEDHLGDFDLMVKNTLKFSAQ